MKIKFSNDSLALLSESDNWLKEKSIDTKVDTRLFGSMFVVYCK